MEPEGSLPQSQVPATCPYLEPARSSPLLRLHQNISPGPGLNLWPFLNMIRFYGEELLAPLPTPKLEYHPLSAVSDRLFNIFAATHHIGGLLHPQPEDALCSGDRDTLITDLVCIDLQQYRWQHLSYVPYQWFPNCTPWVPRNPSPVPRGSVDTFMSWLL